MDLSLLMQLRAVAESFGHAWSLLRTGAGTQVLALVATGWHVVSQAFTGQSEHGSWLVDPSGFAYSLGASGTIHPDPIARCDRIGKVRRWL
jgi:hypothetical protein